MSSDLRLSVSEDAIYRLLRRSGDVPISRLYRAVRLGGGASTIVREQQAYLGPFITRLNKKLATQRRRVVPGVARRTYRLTQIDA